MAIERTASLSLTLNINGVPYAVTPTAEPHALRLLKAGATVPYILRLSPSGGLRVSCDCPDSVQGKSARCKHSYAVARMLLVLACTMSGLVPPPPPSLEFPTNSPTNAVAAA